MKCLHHLNCFFQWSSGSTSASGFHIFVQFLSSHEVMHHIRFGNILLLQTTLMLRKAGPGMLSVFVVNLKTSWAKMLCVCVLWKNSFSGCSTSKAHILGCPVLGQLTAEICPCVVVNKKDNDRCQCGTFENATLAESNRQNNEWEKTMHWRRTNLAKETTSYHHQSKSGLKEMDKTTPSSLWHFLQCC